MAAETAAAAGLERFYDSDVKFLDMVSLNDMSWKVFLPLSGEPSYGGELDGPPEGAYRFFLSSGSRYIVAMGAVVSGDEVLAQSVPVVLKFDKKFSFSSALTVYGGIHNINGNSWHPKSNNAAISNGGVDGVSSIYYEGKPHNCESSVNPAACYDGISPNDIFVGDVVYGGEVNAEARSLIEELYNDIKNSGNLITNYNDIEWIGRDEDCGEANKGVGVNQVAFLPSFSARNNSKFCGVVIVWGGSVEINEFELNGNENVSGTVLVGNFGMDANGNPDFSKASEVNITINGGGKDGSIFFNRDVIKKALLGVGLTQQDIEKKYFPVGSSSSHYVLRSWQ